MKFFIFLYFLIFSSLASGSDYFLARVTYYTGSQTASGKKPIQGLTVAAEKKYKFGTKLHIPEMKGKIGSTDFVVTDRGPAVQSRKASRGKYPVIDIYVSSKARVNQLAKLKNNIVKVYKK